MVTVDDVRHTATLARLRFTESEEKVLAEEMGEILQYVEKLRELDTTDVEPMTHVIESQAAWREDTVEQNTETSGALSNAPDADEEYFRVPKVIR